MSKERLLEIGQMNIFPNMKPKVTFLKGKNETTGELETVIADFSGYDSAKGYDIKAINGSYGEGKDYIRLSFTVSHENDKTYFNGALFKNANKREGSNDPDFTGSLDLTRDRNGEKLDLSGWNKTGRESGKPFISISARKPKDGNKQASSPAKSPNSQVPFTPGPHEYGDAKYPF
jgi:hypothetical protein